MSRLTGISPHTLRVWERRYGAVAPERSDGGTREYSDEQVDKLLLLRTLSESGHAIGRIASLELAQLEELLAEARRRGRVAEESTSPAATVVSATIAAIATLDIASAEAALIEASAVLSPLTLVFDVVAPLVEAIGADWQAGTLRIANEHAATSVLRTLLGTFLGKQSARNDAPRAIVATISGELHELGGLMAAFVAVTQGWRVTYLGPNLPPTEIGYALETTSAKLLMISIVNQRSDESATALRQLRAVLSPDTDVLVGGRAAAEYADIFDPDERVSSLQLLRDRLARGGR